MNAVASLSGPTALAALSADAAARRQALRTVVADPQIWAALEQRAGLLAEQALLVPAAVLDQLRRAVAALDQFLRRQAPAAARPGVLGYDFHLGPNGPRLIEVNTNPGGLLLVLAQQRAWSRLHPDVEPAGLDAPRAEDLALRAFAGSARHLAVVDDMPEQQFLYPEFLMYRRGFARLGIDAQIVDGRHWPGGFDGAYNRLTDFALDRPEHAALAIACRSGQVTLIPDPASHQAFADKRRLADLSADPLCGAWVAPVFQGAWKSTWTVRHGLFFKPFFGYGGRGGYRGDKISRVTWERLDPATTLAQALVPPSVLDNGFKVDIRAYVDQGNVLAFGARLYQGQITNFRTPGGGLAAVFRTHDP